MLVIMNDICFVHVVSLVSEDKEMLSDVKQLVSQLYESLHVERFQLQREQELHKRLEDLKIEISPLEMVGLGVFLFLCCFKCFLYFLVVVLLCLRMAFSSL